MEQRAAPRRTAGWPVFPLSLKELVAGAFALVVVVGGATWTICNKMHDQSDSISDQLDTKLDKSQDAVVKNVIAELDAKSDSQGQ